MSQTEGDLWAAQIDTGNWLVSGRRVEQVVVSPRGEMALKRTVHPLDFIAVKRELAEKPSREAEMAPKDRLQADVMQYLLEEALSHLESAQ